MPYIKQNYRIQFNEGIEELVKKINLISDIDNQSKDGLLNYIFTTLMDRVYENRNYHVYNEMIGTLECCKLELYRRMISPYEDIKIRENEDVFQNVKSLKDDY